MCVWVCARVCVKQKKASPSLECEFARNPPSPFLSFPSSPLSCFSFTPPIILSFFHSCHHALKIRFFLTCLLYRKKKYIYSQTVQLLPCLFACLTAPAIQDCLTVALPLSASVSACSSTSSSSFPALTLQLCPPACLHGGRMDCMSEYVSEGVTALSPWIT